MGKRKNIQVFEMFIFGCILRLLCFSYTSPVAVAAVSVSYLTSVYKYMRVCICIYVCKFIGMSWPSTEGGCLVAWLISVFEIE